MQGLGLLCFHQPIVFPRNNGCRNSELPVMMLKSCAAGIMSAASAALAQIWDGRTAISSGNPLNFSGTGLGPKIFRRSSDHISLLNSGDALFQL